MQDNDRTPAPEKTRNDTLVELAAAATQLLTDHVGLPELHSMHLSSFSTGSGQIDLHLASPAGAVDVAVWARALGGLVEITDQSNSINCETTATKHGFPVRVWTHLKLRRELALLTQLDLADEAGGSVKVDPAQLLDVPLADRADAATAVK